MQNRFHLSHRRREVVILVRWPEVLFLCPSFGIASLHAKMSPQATIDRLILSGSACHLHVTACIHVCLRACMDICVQCMCQGQLFFLFLSRAWGKSPSSLSKCSFLQGMAIDCHHSPPLINPSQWQSPQSETSVAENICLFNFHVHSLGHSCWQCKI